MSRYHRSPEDSRTTPHPNGSGESVLFYVLLGAVSRLRQSVFRLAQKGGYGSVTRASNFEYESPGAEFAHPLQRDGFIYTPLKESSLRIVNWGQPEGKTKLEIPVGGVRIDLPYEVSWVRIRAAYYSQSPVLWHAYCGNNIVAQTRFDIEMAQLQSTTVNATQIDAMQMHIDDGESLIYEVLIPRAGI